MEKINDVRVQKLGLKYCFHHEPLLAGLILKVKRKGIMYSSRSITITLIYNIFEINCLNYIQS